MRIKGVSAETATLQGGDRDSEAHRTHGELLKVRRSSHSYPPFMLKQDSGEHNPGSRNRITVKTHCLVINKASMSPEGVTQQTNNVPFGSNLKMYRYFSILTPMGFAVL